MSSDDDFFGRFISSDKRTEKKNETLNDILTYEKQFARIAKDFAPEIQMMHDLLRDLRNEEREAYEHIAEIELAISKDDVIPLESKLKWLEQYRKNMDASFRMSETIIQHYMVKNLEEFKLALKEAKDKV